MRLLTALVIATAGCRFGFDRVPIAAVEPDRFDRCAAELVDLGPWSAPTKVAGVNASMEDDDARLHLRLDSERALFACMVRERARGVPKRATGSP